MSKVGICLGGVENGKIIYCDDKFYYALRIFLLVFVLFLDIVLWLLSQYRCYLLSCIFVSVACMIYRRLSVLESRRLVFVCFLLTFSPPIVFAFVFCIHNSFPRVS